MLLNSRANDYQMHTLDEIVGVTYLQFYTLSIQIIINGPRPCLTRTSDCIHPDILAFPDILIQTISHKSEIIHLPESHKLRLSSVRHICMSSVHPRLQLVWAGYLVLLGKPIRVIRSRCHRRPNKSARQ